MQEPKCQKKTKKGLMPVEGCKGQRIVKKKTRKVFYMGYKEELRRRIRKSRANNNSLLYQYQHLLVTH